MASKYFKVPFANAGDKTSIPEASQPNGDVSFTEGYTPDYEKDQATDPDAKDVSRQSDNYFKFVVTEALKELQEIGSKPYDPLVNYPVDAKILGSDGDTYTCLIANGPDNLPVVDPVGDTTFTWTNEISVGTGSVTPQPNAAFQSVRDHLISNGFSTHGFIISDLFAIDTSAMNCFGSDVEIGDGSHAAPFLIDHVNDFQTRDIIELGLGGMTSHGILVTFTELRSGTISRSAGITIVDPLGQYDTPGLNIPNFEVNGAAQINNNNGIVTAIKHGLNPRSAHFSAGVNDVGANITTGGAPVDCECPVIIRQVTPSTTKTTGALLITDGGIGCNGAVFAADEVACVGAAPIFRLRDAVNAVIGYIQHSAGSLNLVNSGAGDINLAVSGVAVVTVKTDRLIPTTDDNLYLGDATHRWKQLFAITDVINTSDGNEKNIISEIPNELLDAWSNVKSYLFQWKTSVEEKGEDARIHSGFIAQQIESILTDAGIDGFKYGLLCKDELTENVIKTRKASRQKTEEKEIDVESFTENENGDLIRTIVKEIQEIPVTKDVKVLNPDGSPYLVDDGQAKREVVKSVPVMEEYDEEYTEVEKTGETRMGLRYTQCMIIETAYLRREMGRLNGKV